MSVIAIAVSDLHLSHRAPIARSVEKDWYGCQRRMLHEIVNLANKHDVPLLIAGDLFDKWNSPLELVYLAFEELQRLWRDSVAIPGQHDLPDHNFNQRHRSAYGLCEMGKLFETLALLDDSINWLSGKTRTRVVGFPWGMLPRLQNSRAGGVIALIHHYVWINGKTHGGELLDSDHAKQVRNKFTSHSEKWQLVIAGDNHKKFLLTSTRPWILNCGTTQRRRIDEIDFKPTAWIIDSVYKVTAHRLDVSKDKFIDLSNDELQEYKALDLDGLVTDLQATMSAEQDDSISYENAVRQLLERRKVRSSVTKLILNAIGDEI